MSQSSMSAVRALIREAAADGVRLWVADNRLHFKVTRGELSESLRSRLRTSIDQLTGELSRPVVRRRSRAADLLRFPNLWLDFWLELQSNLTLANSTHAVLNLGGEISSQSIAAAFATLCRRHELLCARLQLRDDVPCVLFGQEPVAPVNIVDMSTGASRGDLERQREIIEHAIWDPLENGAVFRACVVRISAQECFVVFVLHHFVSDFTSCQILARELVALLSGKQLQPSEPIQYFDYMSALIEWLAGPGPTYRLAYWREQLRHAPQTRLPVDQEHAEPSGALDAVTFELDAIFRERIAELAAAHGVTLADVFLAASFAALSEVTGCTDLLTVLIISGREDPSLAHMVGNTVDCLPVRVSVSPQMGARQLIQQVRASSALAKHYRVPWSLLMRTLDQAGIRCAAPLFNFIRGGGEQPPKQFVEAETTDVGGLRIRRPPEQASVDWKTHQLDVFDSGSALFGSLKYDPTMHRRETAEALQVALLGHLKRMAGNTAGESGSAR